MERYGIEFINWGYKGWRVLNIRGRSLIFLIGYFLSLESSKGIILYLKKIFLMGKVYLLLG